MAAGQRVNPIPARTAYMPLEHPVVVISPYFRAQYPVDLNIIGEKDFTVVDVNGTTIFKLKSKSMSLHGRRKLMDASGNVLLSMSQKMMTAHRRWKLYRGDSNCKEENDDDDLLFSVRESSMLQSKNKLDVFLAGNAEEKVPDFRVEGRFGRGSCDVYLGKTDKIIAQLAFQVESGFFGKSMRSRFQSASTQINWFISSALLKMGKASLFRVSMAVLEGIFAWSFGIISVSYINVPTGRGSFAETLILFGRWLIREVVLLLIVLGAETLIIA
ncbi:Protein LURP-one-related 15, partial [Linum perenne]